MKSTVDFFRSSVAADSSPLRITDEAESCAAVLMACLRANELDGDEENATFYTAIKSRNIFKGRDGAALIETAGQYYRQAGSPVALIDAAIGAIREQTRLPLFYHCLDVILADGVVTPQEHKVFQYLKGKFKVDDDTAWKALELLVVKNQL
ncbi:MAG: TerB family tellurite resistance protein [Lewinellaceae bacterium]|nr:TerB family tellurite resistance protein [Lewinellaceae bacterium]